MKFLYLLLLSTLLISVIIFGAPVVYNKYDTNKLLIEQSKLSLNDLSKSKSNEIGEFIDNEKNNLEYLSTSPLLQKSIDEQSLDTSSLNVLTISRLREFKESGEYENLILMNAKGEIIWTEKDGQEIGIRKLNSSDEDVLNQIYLKSIQSKKTEVLGIKIDSQGKKSAIFIATPIFKEESFMGILTVQISNSKIENLLSSIAGIGKTGEIYIIDKNKYHLTSIKSPPHMVSLTHKIDTEGAKKCFLEKEGISIYTNYRNNLVVGAYNLIPKEDWCVLAEREVSELEGKYFSNKKIEFQISSIIFLLIIIISFAIILDSKYEIRSRK